MENAHISKKHRSIDAWVYPYGAPRNIFFKLLYLYLQHELSENEVYECYLQFPEFSGISEKKRPSFFEQLLNECNPGPFHSIENVITTIENYLYSKSIDFHTRFGLFIENLIKFRPDFINLSIFEQFQPLLKHVNLKENLLSNAHLIPPILMPDATSSLVKFENNSFESYAVIAVSSKTSELLSIDIEFIFESIFRFFPLLFGVTPFSGFTVMAEKTSVSQKISNLYNVSTENGIFLIEKKPIGIVIDFSVFIRKNGISDRTLLMKPAKVCVPEKDFYCKKRKQVILKKDCAYGAPVSLIRLSQSTKTSNKDEFFNFSSFQQNRILSRIGQKHENLLSLLDSTALCVTYNKRLQNISINGIFITGGVQAKMLSMIFKQYFQKGHSEFEWKEFAAENELICDPYSTGISTRLKRAMQCLTKVTNDIILEKYGRGKYRLVCKKSLSYSEI